ncbi:transporter substrate-binding domain-containing protein [uncultured Pseudodesulfovibrio sp.]|uniref:transporter substrate-binding domain-containing protein n=1 Tax=uncultured Pseudodesulfovibrio sp. TaxID=2035858 RepID=UPI0029C6A615|nr:transporter substrate-binding domain-containing protein [uncultured Pseudodesulfovibrio sp.]
MTKISRRSALAMIGTAGLAASLAPSFVLASNKSMICNWNRNFPPYSMERNGKMTGILVECMDELLGRRMGYTLEHLGYGWPKAQDLVRAGKGDTLCTNPTKARMQYMLFSEEPMVESLPSIFCLNDNPRINEINQVLTLGDLKDFRQVDYAGNGWARQTFPPYLRIAQAPDLFEAFKMIAQDKADIFVGNGLAAMYAIKVLGLKNRIHARELPVGEPSTFHFGLRRDYPDAKKIMDEFAGTLDEAQLEGATRKIILNYL